MALVKSGLFHFWNLRWRFWGAELSTSLHTVESLIQNPHTYVDHIGYIMSVLKHRTDKYSCHMKKVGDFLTFCLSAVPNNNCSFLWRSALLGWTSAWKGSRTSTYSSQSLQFGEAYQCNWIYAGPPGKCSTCIWWSIEKVQCFPIFWSCVRHSVVSCESNM